MVASDIIAAHAGARLACIEVGRRTTPEGLLVHHFGLAEGLPAEAVSGLLETWHRRYGIRATTAGTPFALRLPLPLGQVATPGIAELHHLPLQAAQPLGHVLQAGRCDLWIACADAEAARALARQLAGQLPPRLPVAVDVGEPAWADLECWEALRLAHEVAPDMAW